MADETTKPEAQETKAEKEEPQGTDWKAEARKHERRAKESKKALDELEKKLAEYETKAEEKEASEKSAAETIAELKKQLAEAKAEREREAMVREVAKAKNVDADVLLRMSSKDQKETEENADLLLQSMKRRWPEVPDKGSTKAVRLTKEQILAEKNPQKQLRMIAENRDLFK